MTPWWARVDMAARAVDSCPPPWVPEETKTPAYFPVQRHEVLSDVVTRGVRGPILLTIKCPRLPKAASGIDERLPLTREVTVTGGNTKEESIILLQLVVRNGGVVALGRCVHLCKDLLRECLGDPARQC